MITVRLIFFVLVIASALHGQVLQLVSGSGQVVRSQFREERPFVVRAVNAAGQPAAGVPITWTVTPFSAGSLIIPSSQTNAQGEASAGIVGSIDQIGASFARGVVTATAPASGSSVNLPFIVIPTGAPQPSVTPIRPTQGGSIEGASGAILPGAISVKVVAVGGSSSGSGLPNVGVRVEPVQPSSGPTAACNAPAGIVVTGDNGVATCDLILSGTPGTVQMQTWVGEISSNLKFNLTVTQGQNCTFSVAPLAQSFIAAGSSATVNISAAQGCSWAASSAAPWITITSATSGQGNGTITYSVAANQGAQRSGTLTVAGQTVTVTQAAFGSIGGPAIAFAGSPTLPGATSGSSYSIGLNVTGGTPPYRWSSGVILPPGLALDTTTGLLSGVPTAVGTFTIPVTVTDSLNVSATQTFTLSVSQPGSVSPTLMITTTAFGSGSVGIPYQQSVTTSGGCSNPFSGPPAITLASGSLPPGLTLQPIASGFGIAGTPTTAGTYAFALRAAACAESTTREFSIVITGTTTNPSPITASPSELVFTTNLGGVTRPADQNIQIASAIAGTGFNITVSTASGGNWLAASPAAGVTPAAVTVGVVNTAALASGSYQGAVHVAPQAGGSPVSIPVTLNITAPLTISVAPNAIRFDHALNAVTLSEQNVSVSSPFGTPAGVAFVAAIGASAPWLTVPQSGTTPATLRFIANSAGLPAGNYETTVTIAPASNPTGGQAVRVTLIVGAAPALLPAPANLTFTGSGSSTPAPQTLNITAAGLPVSFNAVASTLSGGNWLFVAPASGVTPAALNVSVNPANVPPGLHNGTITLRSDATSAPVVVAVQLNVTAANPAISSITNAASFAAGGVAPGEFVTIFGANLGPAAPAQFRFNSSGRIESTLSGTRVLFDDIPAPLIYTSAGQISAIVPYALSNRASTRVIVEYLGVRSNQTEVPVVESAPAMFIIGSGSQGAIVNQDGTINGLQGAASAGSIVSIYATGEGVLTPAAMEGTLASGDNLARPLLSVSVQINGQQAEVLYAGVAPGLLTGVLQVNARVPEGVPAGSAPITITIGSTTSPAATIAVR
jgi:uncharacterized protein (TIGR03437 family)